MTREDIVRLAREVGGSAYTHSVVFNYEEITTFANLVAEHEREQCAQIAREIGTSTETDDFALDKCYEIESAIRARGEK
jgi:hypothetical protein